MKLQNNQTGQVENFCIDKDQICSCDRAFVYDSLTQLQEAGWKDYEEPKETALEEMIRKLESDFEKYPDEWDNLEEAEKIVEKLKAWKRLKDSGFTIRQWRHTPDMNLTTGSFINIKGFISEVVKNMKDLDLLFSEEGN